MGKNIAQQKQQDESTVEQINEGCSLAQLGRLFRMKPETIRMRIATVPPAGLRHGSSIWHVKEVAPFLVKPVGDFESAIKRMNPDDLPPSLTREYWLSKKARREYEFEMSKLLDAEEVLSGLSTVLNQFRVDMLLVKDNASRLVGPFTSEQRSKVAELIDIALNDLSTKLENLFPEAHTVEDDEPQTPPAPGLGDDGDADLTDEEIAAEAADL